MCVGSVWKVWRLLWWAAMLAVVTEGAGADVYEEMPSSGFSRQRSLQQAMLEE